MTGKTILIKKKLSTDTRTKKILIESKLMFTTMQYAVRKGYSK